MSNPRLLSKELRPWTDEEIELAKKLLAKETKISRVAPILGHKLKRKITKTSLGKTFSRRGLKVSDYLGKDL